MSRSSNEAGAALRLAALGLALLALWLSACSSPSSLVVRGQASPASGPVQLIGDFDTAWYATTDENAATFVLLDGPAHRPRQAAVIELFWRPRAGLTPLEAAATNMTVTHLVFAQRGAELGRDADDRGEVGVYAGAGFLFPRRALGARTLVAGVWDASLQLETRSAGFVDLLGLSTMTGSFTATRDDQRVEAVLEQLSAMVRDRLGFPRPLGG